MPKMEPLPVESAPPKARPVLDAFMADRGNVPNMFRTLARRPELLVTAAQHLQAVTNSGSVPPRIKESLAVYVSLRNSCRY